MLRPIVVVSFLLMLSLCDTTWARSSSPGEQSALSESTPPTDWLIDASPFVARVDVLPDGEIAIGNGLFSRKFATKGGLACVAFDDLVNSRSLLRSVRPEARLVIDGRTFTIGGPGELPHHGFIRPEWPLVGRPEDGGFVYVGHRVVDAVEPRIAWKPRASWLSQKAVWPPRGKTVDFRFEGPRGLLVSIIYEVYDGIPLVSKRMVVLNSGSAAVRIERLAAEILAVVETASVVDGTTIESFLPNMRPLHVVTDYSFGGTMDEGSSGPAVGWIIDPEYATQVHYEKRTPCLLECAPPIGPDADLLAGEKFESFRVFELVQDSTDRERRGLAVRKMYRTAAPWCLENPLIFHVRSANPEDLFRAVDQAAEVGFEIVLMTFGSGFDFESTDESYIARIKAAADYAHSRGIALGGYSLLASRSVSAADDVVNPSTKKTGGFARFGNSPCLGSKWGIEYFARLRNFIEKAGLDVLEHDGSYPGDFCASESHPGHRGLADSQWRQWRMITDFYAWCRARGIYLNVPDWYYLSGSSKCGMGYRETNWSLPRAEQEIIERQNIFDGTWTKTPSMGWMFVPLSEYHGGGAAATIEPLAQHLPHYAARLDNLLGSGVQACWRGPRLFDADATRQLLKGRVDWFKKHRTILEADIVHGRRADARDIDWMLHVDPKGDPKGMLVVWNPLDRDVVRKISVDLTYTGLVDLASIVDPQGQVVTVPIDRRGRAAVTVELPKTGFRAFEIR